MIDIGKLLLEFKRALPLPSTTIADARALVHTRINVIKQRIPHHNRLFQKRYFTIERGIDVKNSTVLCVKLSETIDKRLIGVSL